MTTEQMTTADCNKLISKSDRTVVNKAEPVISQAFGVIHNLWWPQKKNLKTVNYRVALEQYRYY